MANSRLERIGTIYTRITGLLRSGALKSDDKPLWYDLYEAFPPKYPPLFERPEQKGEITKIFYPEDTVRAQIHKNKAVAVGTINLQSSRQTNSQRCIQLFEELKSEGLEEVEALNKAVEKVLVERSAGSSTTHLKAERSIAEEFKVFKKINVGEIMEK